MDDAVYTFEQLVHQSLEGNSGEDLCKTVQRCQDRVLKVSALVGSLKLKRVCLHSSWILAVIRLFFFKDLLHFNSVYS